ncbi:MAG: RagB/SusD family nutrient uptake outer membrane protein, partial [Sphingobacterium sp.]
MKTKKLIMQSLVISIGFMGLYSCKKDAINTNNENVVSTDQYFKTAVELQAGTNAIYATVRGINLVAREWYFLHDLRSDDVAAGGSQLEVPRAQILNGNVDPTNSVMNAVWNGLYTVIHRANT